MYQTLFMLELSEALNQKIEEIHLQTDKPSNCYKPHVYGDVCLSKNAAEFLAPLLELQGWKTSISDSLPKDFFDLDRFRQLKLNFGANDIRAWVYNLTAYQLPMNLQRQTISKFPIDASFADKVVLAKTDRYINPFIDYGLLKPLKDKIVFIGLPQEHKAFCDTYFKVDYEMCPDAVKMMSVIAGAKTFIANQCGPYSLAEQAKTRRCLLTSEFMVFEKIHRIVPGPVNVIPQGGEAYMCGTNERFKSYIERLMK